MTCSPWAGGGQGVMIVTFKRWMVNKTRQLDCRFLESLFL
jgi:hypothetical protein